MTVLLHECTARGGRENGARADAAARSLQEAIARLWDGRSGPKSIGTNAGATSRGGMHIMQQVQTPGTTSRSWRTTTAVASRAVRGGREVLCYTETTTANLRRKPRTQAE